MTSNDRNLFQSNLIFKCCLTDMEYVMCGMMILEAMTGLAN